MSSEFQQLSDKIALLAEMTQSLRLENAELRRHVSELTNENAELASRIEGAHQRVVAVLEKLPATSLASQRPAIDEEENV
jgi:cell division protein ZapB